MEGFQNEQFQDVLMSCTHFLSSDTSTLVPNLMCFRGPLLLRATLMKQVKGLQIHWSFNETMP